MLGYYLVDLSRLMKEVLEQASRYTQLECKRCKRKWNYKGKRKYAQCPNCLTSVKVTKN